MVCPVELQLTLTITLELPWPVNHSLNILHASLTSIAISTGWNVLLLFLHQGLFSVSLKTQLRYFLFWNIFLSFSGEMKSPLSCSHYFFVYITTMGWSPSSDLFYYSPCLSPKWLYAPSGPKPFYFPEFMSLEPTHNRELINLCKWWMNIYLKILPFYFQEKLQVVSIIFSRFTLT